MMSLQYQDFYQANKIRDGLDTYCRLEGLDPLYVRSIGKEGKVRLESILISFFGRLSVKLSRHMVSSGQHAATDRIEPQYPLGSQE